MTAPVRASGWPPDRTVPARLRGERTVPCPDCDRFLETDAQLRHHAALFHGGPAPERYIDAGNEVGP